MSLVGANVAPLLYIWIDIVCSIRQSVVLYYYTTTFNFCLQNMHKI